MTDTTNNGNIPALHTIYEPTILNAKLSYNNLYKRHLIANKNLQQGDIILIEQSILYSTFNEQCCIWCNTSEHETIDCKILNNKLNQSYINDICILQQQLADIEYIDEIDHSNQIIKIMLYNRINDNIEEYNKLLQCIEQLNHTDLNKYSNTIKAIKNNKIIKKYKLINDIMTIERIKLIISILNNNTHQLDSIEGSGLTIYGSMLTHSCLPNCTFTSINNQLYIYAITNIKTDDILTIDYLGDTLYKPTIYRQIELINTKEFLCQCQRCISIDLTRSFICNNCNSGIVCALNDGLHIDNNNIHNYNILIEAIDNYKPDITCNYICNQCNYNYRNTDTIKQYINIEQQSQQLQDELTIELLEYDNNEQCINIIKKYINQIESYNILHNTHYILYELYYQLCRIYVSSNNNNYIKQAIELYNKLITNIYIVYPQVSDQQCVIYDELAQCYILIGEINNAINIWQKAYNICIILNGINNKTTLQYKNLIDKPPQNKDELIQTYTWTIV